MQQITALLVFVESTVPKCCRTKVWLQFLLLMFFFAFLLNFFDLQLHQYGAVRAFSCLH